MIFFGTSKERTTDTQLVQFETCPSCQAKDTTYVTTLIKYAHIYWIPLVPAGKRTVVFCTNCKKNQSPNALSANGTAFCNEFEESQSYPFYYFALLLIALGGGAFMFLSFLFRKIVAMF